MNFVDENIVSKFQKDGHTWELFLGLPVYHMSVWSLQGGTEGFCKSIVFRVQWLLRSPQDALHLPEKPTHWEAVQV